MRGGPRAWTRDGGLVLLADQDRARWDAGRDRRGLRAHRRALALRGAAAPTLLQALIAAEHARRRAGDRLGDGSPRSTTRLAAIDPQPVVALNRAVAVAMASGPEAGLALSRRWPSRSPATTSSTPPGPTCCAGSGAARRRAAAYARALELAGNPVEREFLAGRLRETSDP